MPRSLARSTPQGQGAAERTDTRRVFREVFVLTPATDEADPDSHEDHFLTIGPCVSSDVEDIVQRLPAVGLPDDVLNDVATALRGGRPSRSS